MSSKRRVRREMHDGKMRYNREEAIGVSRHLSAKYNTRMSAYQCEFYGGWHVGHTPSKVKRVMAQRREAYRRMEA